MRLNGKDFDDSTALLRTERDLKTIAGNMPRFPEYPPRAVPIRYVMEVLLHILYRKHICCNHLGIFVSYKARVFNMHESICLYVAKYDAPLLNVMVQSGGSADFINLEGFH